MTDRIPADPIEALRLLLGEADVRWPDEQTRIDGSLMQEKLDAALATERRLTIEQVERALFSVAPPGDQGDDWAFAVLALLAAASPSKKVGS